MNFSPRQVTAVAEVIIAVNRAAEEMKKTEK